VDSGDVARGLLCRAYARRAPGPRGVELLPFGEVAPDVGLDSDTLPAIVEGLERGGYVEDARIGVTRGNTYTITPKGKAWVGE
jgi:DNA-binding MarR family transcriptional regulator